MSNDEWLELWLRGYGGMTDPVAIRAKVDALLPVVDIIRPLVTEERCRFSASLKLAAARESYLATSDFATHLRSLNADRCVKHFHPLGEMTVLEWAGAMAGEAGEAANKAKKLRFRRAGVTADDVAEEVADTVIYADLLLASMGAPRLDVVVRRKFNRRSAELGYPSVL